MVEPSDNTTAQGNSEQPVPAAAIATPAPKKKILKIRVDRDLCIGAASCLAIAPDVFDLDSEGKAIVKDGYDIDDETLMAAAESCPTQAIFLYDEDGNQIYP